MTPPRPNHVVIVGAGAAGLMAARELVRAGRRVTILEARERCGGRIYPLSAVEFGYPAEAGAEFVHGEASLTRAVLREARLSLSPVEGRRWRVRDGAFSRSDAALPHAHQLSRALAGLDADLPIAEFLERHFVGRQYGELRRVIERMVEGYDAADPARASTFALRSEWLGHGPAAQGRIAGGYGALIDFLAAECRVQGVSIHLGAEVKAIEASGGLTFARCRDGSTHAGEAMILTVPLPLLSAIALPSSARAKAAVRAEIGFGNVVKILLRFETRWWEHVGGKDLTDLSFLHSGTMVPTWWTQYPAEDPVLTGWFAGPKTASVAQLAEDELIELALASLAEAFCVSGPSLKAGLLGARAINWANDPFARGGYSYATLGTREAQSLLAHTEDGAVFYSGEALYRGPEMGTVEAALASGLETARMLLAAGQ